MEDCEYSIKSNSIETAFEVETQGCQLAISCSYEDIQFSELRMRGTFAIGR